MLCVLHVFLITKEDNTQNTLLGFYLSSSNLPISPVLTNMSSSPLKDSSHSSSLNLQSMPEVPTEDILEYSVMKGERGDRRASGASMSIVGESRFEDRSVIFKTWEIKALMFSFFTIVIISHSYLEVGVCW